MRAILAIFTGTLLLGLALPGPATADGSARGADVVSAAAGYSPLTWSAASETAEDDGYSFQTLDRAGGGTVREGANEVQGMRLLLDGEEIIVGPLAGETPSWGLSLSLSQNGSGDDRAAEDGTAPETAGSLASIRHGGVTAWYRNNRRGLEQRIVVSKPAEGAKSGGALRVEMSLRTDLVPEFSPGGEGVLFRNPFGRGVLYYDLIVVHDAGGRVLPAVFEGAGAGGRESKESGVSALTVTVDDAGAVYPVTVDAMLYREKNKLLAFDGEANDDFGETVAVSGDTAVVGAVGDDDLGSSAGAVYIYERDQGGPGNWGLVTKLTASDGAGGNRFGNGVAIDGDTILVGTQGAAAYIFERDQGGPGNWGEAAILAVTAWDREIDLSGDTAVVTNYVFGRDQGGPGNWGQVTQLSTSGNAVAIAGDRIAVGVPCPGYHCNLGTVYLHERNEGGPGNWGLVITLTASDMGTEDMLFGAAVALSGDLLFVGADGHTAGGMGAGAVYLFERDHGGPGNWGEVMIITSPDATEDDLFGDALSLSGDTLAVGARGDYGGSAYLFRMNQDGAGAWGFVQKLIPLFGRYGEDFGTSVSLSGDTLFAGAPDDNDNGSGAGAAYFFHLDNPHDFNGDLTTDLLWRNYSTGANYLWYMDGTTPMGGMPLPSVVDTNWSIGTAADFNGDLGPDLFWRNYSTGANYLWYVDGTTVTGGTPLPSIADTDWSVAGSGDFNGDGLLDVLWRNVTTGANYLWFMWDGMPFSGALLPANADISMTIVGVEDFNEDGRPDILWRNISTGANMLWYMNGIYLAGSTPVDGAAVGWDIDGVSDFNGDGSPDLCWRDYATGGTYLWYMDGSVPTGGEGLPTVSDTDWHIEN